MVNDHELGMREEGYEIGVRTMRMILQGCHTTKKIVLLLDFIKAFNTCGRNVLLLLTAALVPELTKLVEHDFAIMSAI